MTDCEPLRGKMKKHAPHNKFYAEDVASAVRFYKKYKNKPDVFALEYKEHNPNIAEELYKIMGTGISFNDWLFDYTFGDVINDAEETGML